MGKKAKIGKRRRDKFYHLAKETGYRARSAFKLIQLNRKYNFLQQSRVLIDLCAAPGGWLQVASNHMPMSSVIVGVDLVKIKPIHNVITIQADITTPKCRQLLQRELKTWKADCVLNDGAPNVGTAWLQDAFTQAELTLSAVKLASEFLKPGGTFVTKVFRSKDYQSLLTVFEQLFRKVHATKPQASRNESAEIFVVCQGYKHTKKPDPKLLDPKFVFEEPEITEKPVMSLQRIQKPPKAAEGYDEGQTVLYQSASVLDFVTSEDHMTVLGTVHRLTFDKSCEVFAKHPETTAEIREYCQDIKVLGLRELKMLIKWREKMQLFLDSIEESDNEMEVDKEESEEETALAEVEERVKEMEKEEKAVLKNALKRQKKRVKRTMERIQSHKETHQEVAELIADTRTFSLKSVTSSNHLKALEGGVVYSDSEGEEFNEVLVDPFPPGQGEDEEEGVVSEDEEDGGVVSEDEEGSEEEEKTKEVNPLLVKLNNKQSTSSITNQWFSNDAFRGLTGEGDELMELESAMEAYGKKKKGKKPTEETKGDTSEGENEAGDVPREGKRVGFEVVPLEEQPPPAKVRKLDPEGLAMGALLVSSKKKRTDLIDSGFNRWAHNDDDMLPDWFMEDETKHCHQKQLPITKEMVEQYRSKLKEINARPIKKIAEAKARKKQRSMKKLANVRKRAEVICDNSEVTDQEKAHQIRNMYKKAGLLSQKKQEVKYVVAKKGVGRRVRRPQGVTGKFKVVDPRMKKDKRKMTGKNGKQQKPKRRKHQ